MSLVLQWKYTISMSRAFYANAYFNLEKWIKTEINYISHKNNELYKRCALKIPKHCSQMTTHTCNSIDVSLFDLRMCLCISKMFSWYGIRCDWVAFNGRHAGLWIPNSHLKFFALVQLGFANMKNNLSAGIFPKIDILFDLLTQIYFRMLFVFGIVSNDQNECKTFVSSDFADSKAVTFYRLQSRKNQVKYTQKFRIRRWRY